MAATIDNPPAVEPIDPNEVMDKRRLAEVLRCSTRTVERRRNRGHLPQPVGAGREPTWLGSTIIAMYERKAKRTQ